MIEDRFALFGGSNSFFFLKFVCVGGGLHFKVFTEFVTILFLFYVFAL